MPKLVKISNKIINNPDNPKYNTSYLSLQDFDFKKSVYRPKTLISPSVGLINDPCGIYQLGGYYYIQFQHCPIETIHGLKFFSLARTKNFIKYEYNWLVNSPDTLLDNHGCYTGSTFDLPNNNVGLIYTGNYINKYDQRESNVVLAKLNNLGGASDKQKLLDNSDIEEHTTSNFRDPYIFKFKDKQYFVIGSQNPKGFGEILLFLIDPIQKKWKLIKKFQLDEKIYMCECPTVAFFGQTVILLACLQRKPVDKNDTRKTDFVAQFEISISEFFKSKDTELKNYKLFNYGYEYYAPQIFKDKNGYKLIAWSGLPGIKDYPEALKEKWMNVLTPIKRLEYLNDELFVRFLPEYIKEVNDLKEENVFVKQITNNRKNFNHYWYDGDSMVLHIQCDDSQKNLIINRTNFGEFYPFDQVKKIKLKKQIKKINYFFDKSYFEIDIDNGYIVVSGRLYPNYKNSNFGWWNWWKFWITFLLNYIYKCIFIKNKVLNLVFLYW